MGRLIVHGDWRAVPSGVVPSLVLVAGIGVLVIAVSLYILGRIWPYVDIPLLFQQFSRLHRVMGSVLHWDWGMAPSGTVWPWVVVVAGIGVLIIALSMYNLRRIVPWAIVLVRLHHIGPLLSTLGLESILHGDWGALPSDDVGPLVWAADGIGVLVVIVSWIVPG